MGQSYRIGESFIDKGSYRDPDDQFLRWIRGPLNSGIKNTGGIRDLGADRSDTPAALIVVSNEQGISQHEDPWEDTLAVDAGYISYWGDAKPGNRYDESPQNQKIKAAFDQAAAQQREEVPPVLAFRKSESGLVEFCGLCVPDYLEVRSYQDDSGSRIPNYLFHFTILNTHSVPVSWLHDRAQLNGNESAPDVWKNWVRTGEIRQWPTGEQLDRTGGYSRRYEIQGIPVSETFRTKTFERYNHACTITGMREEPILDLAHILPRSKRPDLVEHPENVIVLNALHHRAFDSGLFTLDRDYRIRVSPAFEPAHPFLRETIIDRESDQLSLPSDARIRMSFLDELNDGLAWI